MHSLQPIFTWPFSAHLKQTISPGFCWQWPLPWLPGSCPLLPLPYCPGCCPLGNQSEAGVPNQQSVMSAWLPGSCPLLPLPYCPGCCPLGNRSEAGVPDQQSVMSVAVSLSVIPLISSENLVDICWIMVSNLSYIQLCLVCLPLTSCPILELTYKLQTSSSQRRVLCAASQFYEVLCTIHEMSWQYWSDMQKHPWVLDPSQPRTCCEELHRGCWGW